MIPFFCHSLHIISLFDPFWKMLFAIEFRVSFGVLFSTRKFPFDFFGISSHNGIKEMNEIWLDFWIIIYNNNKNHIIFASSIVCIRWDEIISNMYCMRSILVCIFPLHNWVRTRACHASSCENSMMYFEGNLFQHRE